MDARIPLVIASAGVKYRTQTCVPVVHDTSVVHAVAEDGRAIVAVVIGSAVQDVLTVTEVPMGTVVRLMCEYAAQAFAVAEWAVDHDECDDDAISRRADEIARVWGVPRPS